MCIVVWSANPTLDKCSCYYLIDVKSKLTCGWNKKFCTNTYFLHCQGSQVFSVIKYTVYSKNLYFPMGFDFTAHTLLLLCSPKHMHFNTIKQLFWDKVFKKKFTKFSSIFGWKLATFKSQYVINFILVIEIKLFWI